MRFSPTVTQYADCYPCWCPSTCTYICDTMDWVCYGAWSAAQCCDDPRPGPIDNDGDSIDDCECTCEAADLICETESPTEYNGASVKIRRCDAYDDQYTDCWTCDDISKTGEPGDGDTDTIIDFKITVTNVTVRPGIGDCDQVLELNRTYFIDGCIGYAFFPTVETGDCANVVCGSFVTSPWAPDEIRVNLRSPVGCLDPPAPATPDINIEVNLTNRDPLGLCSVRSTGLFADVDVDASTECIGATGDQDACYTQTLSGNKYTMSVPTTGNPTVWPIAQNGNIEVEILEHGKLVTQAECIAAQEPRVMANAEDNSTNHEARVVKIGSTSDGPILGVAVYKSGSQLGVSGTGFVMDENTVELKIQVCVWDDNGQDKVRGMLCAVDESGNCQSGYCVTVEEDTTIITDAKYTGYGQIGIQPGSLECPPCLYSFSGFMAYDHQDSDLCPCENCPT